VRARPDPRDGRRMLLGLTPRGRAIEIATAGTIEAAVRVLVDTARPADIATTRAVLEQLVAILETPAPA
jgi:hypothetical protein